MAYFKAKTNTENYRSMDNDESEQDLEEQKEEEEENYSGYEQKKLKQKVAFFKAKIKTEHDLFFVRTSII